MRVCQGEATELERWHKDFKRFERPEKTSELPKGYTGEYLIFALSQGDISRREEVAERYTLSDAQKWMALRSYDNIVQEELHKIALARAKKNSG